MREGELVGGRYRLGVRLGRGGMGQVFRATDERLHREVAVKVVDLSQGGDPTVRERFRREAVATARLNHPHIVTIFDAGADAGTAWLVMELLPGQPVSRLLGDASPLPMDAAVRIARGVAQALVATHAIGVVHRDIKPANIMVDGPAVKLLDFGIALVALDAEAHLTAPATTLGTAAYMAPEQARAERATSASDIYALGCVLVAMLTGQPPYRGDNAFQIAQRHITEPPPSLRALRPGLPPALDELVARMMAKDPAARPSAAAVADTLGHLDGAADVSPTAVLPVGPTVAQAPPTAILSAAVADAGGPAGPLPGAGFRRAAAWVALAIAALLVFAVAWAFGSQLFGGGLLTGSAPRTTAPPTSAPPRTSAAPSTAPITLPSVTLPSLPSARDAVLRAAVAGVDSTLASLSTDDREQRRAVEALQKSWQRAGADIVAGKKPQDAVAGFRDDIDKQQQAGRLGVLEAEALRLAVGAVAAAL